MKRSKILATGAAIGFAAVVALIVFSMQRAHYYQSVVGSPLQRDLGFGHGSPYVNFGDKSVEVFTLHPQTGGAMSAAGVRDSDIVLDHSITNFYRALHAHRGSTIAFRVTDGIDGVPLAQRPIRTVTLPIPAQRQNQ